MRFKLVRPSLIFDTTPNLLDPSTVPTSLFCYTIRDFDTCRTSGWCDFDPPMMSAAPAPALETADAVGFFPRISGFVWIYTEGARTKFWP